MKKAPKIICLSVFIIYMVILIGYFLGKSGIQNTGLEYRFWVEAIFRIMVWFVPALFVGILLLLGCIRQWKRKSGSRWVLAIALIVYGLVAAFLSFWYILFNVFTMTTDEVMPDGNLIVAVPEGMEYYHHYAEPVGLFFRRDITFDDERFADSLSKIYGVSFRAEKADGEETVYVSDMYPGIEIIIIRHGYTENTYLDTNFEYALTSQKLEEHQGIFGEQGVDLVPYVFGRTEENPEGYRTYYAVLITDENQEDAATAIAEFIQTTLKEDMRADGKNCWERVDGSIFLVIRNEETGEAESVRNIPFSLRPEYSWVFDETVTREDILEDIKDVLD